MYMIGYGFLSSGFTDQCEILLGGSVVFDCFLVVSNGAIDCLGG